MKKVLLVVCLVVNIVYAEPNGVKPVKVNNEVHQVSLKDMLKGFLNSLQELREEQNKIKDKYDEITKDLGLVTSDLLKITSLIKNNKKSIDTFLNVYEENKNDCNELDADDKVDCLKQAKNGYNDDLKSISGLQDLLYTLEEKLKKAKKTLVKSKVITKNEKRRIKARIEKLERDIKSIKG